MPTEIEAKFLADDAGVLEELAGIPSIGGATLGAPRSIAEVDRYLDTPDRRLGAARWACRLRTREDDILVSLKGPREEGPGYLQRRPEVEGPAADTLDIEAWPPSDARDLLRRLAAGRPLEERFRLVQGRTEREVSMAGEAVGTLTLDHVEIVHGARSAGRLNVVELEAATDDAATTATVERLSTALAAIRGLRPDARSKLDHALAAIAR
jgi:inorganic triphosphatase YgiF